MVSNNYNDIHPSLILIHIEEIANDGRYGRRDLQELQQYLHSASIAAIKDLHYGDTSSYHQFKEGVRLATIVNLKLENKNPEFKNALDKMISMRQNMQPTVLEIEKEYRENNPKINHEWRLFHAEKAEVQEADKVIQELRKSGKFKLINPDKDLLLAIAELQNKTAWDDRSMMEYRQKSLSVIKDHIAKATKGGEIGEPMLLSGMKLAPGVSPAYVAMRLNDENGFMFMEVLPKADGTTSICDNPLGKGCGQIIKLSNDKLLDFFTQTCSGVAKRRSTI